MGQKIKLQTLIHIFTKDCWILIFIFHRRTKERKGGIVITLLHSVYIRMRTRDKNFYLPVMATATKKSKL